MIMRIKIFSYTLSRIIVSLLLIIFGFDRLLPGIISGSNAASGLMLHGVSELLNYPIGFLFLITGIQILIGMRARGMAAILALVLGAHFFLFDTGSIQHVALFGTLLLFVANGSGKYAVIKSNPLFENLNSNHIGDENEART